MKLFFEVLLTIVFVPVFMVFVVAMVLAAVTVQGDEENGREE